MVDKRKIIGILGGTFDPIHYGHLRSAIEIYEQFNLDELYLVPCKHPPHRMKPSASENHRLAMVRLAIEKTKLCVDEREIHRDGPSYSVDTLMSFRRENPKASLCMIVGVDAFLGLPSWYQWEKIIQLANIIVMRRTGWEVPNQGVIGEFLTRHALTTEEHLENFTAGKIANRLITALDISGSMIRTLIKTGQTPRFLLPDAVFTYIQQQALYGYPEGNFSTHPSEAPYL